MDKVKCLVNSLLFLQFIQHCFGQPYSPSYREPLAYYKAEVFLNMTYYLCKDATLKLWHADRVQQKYLGTLAYELGIITAGIQDVFRRMVATYRKYSNLTNFRFEKYYADELYDAYHVVKGDFNAIRMQKKMFLDVLKNHYQIARLTQTTRFRIRQKRRPRRRSSNQLSLNEKEIMYRGRLSYQKWAEMSDFEYIDLKKDENDVN